MFKEEDDPSFRQNQKVSSGGLSISQSARAQKWLDQLVQVESRMLSNWEEFSAHRNEVQHRLAELSETLRRKQEPHLESELEKCSRRLQQLSQSNEETLCRMGDLKTAVENGQQSLEGLRARVSTKLQEMGMSFEEHKKDLLSRVSEELQAEASSSKRQSKALGEELLRKMAELNQKLGENMTSVEEESISRFEGLRGDVQALAKRLDATPRPEVELRKTEAYFESQLRSLRAEMHSQLEELAASAKSSENARVKGLQENAQELTQRLERVASDATSGKVCAERTEQQLQELRQQQRAEMEEQLERLRDEIAVKAGKEAKAQSEALAQLSRKLQSSEELLERCCETSSEVEVLKIADGERAMLLEQLSRSCNELAEGRQGFLAEVDSCRSANRQLEDSLRRMDARVESLSSTASHCSEGVADVKAAAREAEKSQLQFREMLEQRTSELQELLERRAYESSAKMEALRLADAERQRQLEQLSMACENLAEARQGIVAEVESCRSIDRQLEEALRRLDARVERAAGTALQCSEGVADVKVFARELSEKALSQSRDLMEKRSAEMKDGMGTTFQRPQGFRHFIELIEQQAAEHVSKLEALKVSESECHQQLDFLSRAFADLSEARRGIFAEVESCQSSDRKDDVAQQHSSEQLELRSRELKDHLKHLREELTSNFVKERPEWDLFFMIRLPGSLIGTPEAKAQSDAIALLARKQELSTDSLQAGTSELRRTVEAQFRRQELIEHQAAENAPKLEALRSASAEQTKQLQSLGKSSAELSEARRGISADVEKCQSASRRLEEELQHALAKIEKVSSAANQSFEGVAEVKGFARQLVESSVMELKELEQLERRIEVASQTDKQALKTSEVDHQQQLERLWRSHAELTETKKGLTGELEKCQSVERQFEEAIRRVDGKVDRFTAVASQCSEGVSEVKGFARQAVENVVVQSRALLEQRTGEMKEQLERLRDEMAEAKAQSEALAQLSRKVQSTEELLERCRETSSDVEALKTADSERATLLEQLSRSCNELVEGRQGFLAEVDSCRSANRQLEDSLRRMDARVESLSSTASHCSEGVAEVKAAAREAEKSQLQFREMSEQRTNDLQELLERRTYESSAKMEALRTADAERQRQLEQLSMACENLAEARQGIVAEVESCRSIDRQLEEALRRLDARVERAAGTALQCSEGVADVKVFARELSEKAVSQSRDLMEKRHAEMKELVEQQAAEHGSKLEALKVSDSECHQQLDSLSRAVAELSEARRGISAEVESCQSSDRLRETGGTPASHGD
eukprot:s2267_g3.t3